MVKVKMREIITTLENDENKNKMKPVENSNDRYCVRRHMFFAATNPVIGNDLTLEEANILVDELTTEELDSMYVHYEKHLIE